MDKSVEKVISAIHEGGDWKTILTSEFRRQGYRQFQYMNRVIKQIVVQNLPIAFFKECLNYVNGDVVGIHDVDWFRHVIRHGTKEYFLFVLEEVEKEDYMIIFEQGVGRDRLAQLLEWLDDLELVADLLKNYVETQ